MYVRGEFHGKRSDLEQTICNLRDFARANESYTDVSVVYDAAEYLFEILDADIDE